MRRVCASNVAIWIPLAFDPHHLFVGGGTKGTIAAAVVILAILAG